MHQSAKQRHIRGILFVVVIAMIVAVALFGDRASSEFWLRVRILGIALVTFAGVAYLVKGVKTGFSRYGGWRAASGSLAWAAALLLMAGSQVWRKNDPMPSAYVSLLAGAIAVAAVVLQQREHERV